MKKVEILGLARNTVARFNPLDGYELWTFNAWYEGVCPPIIPDRSFQIHAKLLPVYYGVRLYDLDRAHAEYTKWGVTTYCTPASAKLFPLTEYEGGVVQFDPKELYDFFPEEPKEFLFTSTIPYLLAMAVKEGFEVIRILGCPMRDEYAYELPGLVRMVSLIQERYPNTQIEVEYSQQWKDRLTPEVIAQARERAKTAPCYVEMVDTVKDNRLYNPFIPRKWENHTVPYPEEILAHHQAQHPPGSVGPGVSQEKPPLNRRQRRQLQFKSVKRDGRSVD